MVRFDEDTHKKKKKKKKKKPNKNKKKKKWDKLNAYGGGHQIPSFIHSHGATAARLCHVANCKYIFAGTLGSFLSEFFCLTPFGFFHFSSPCVRGVPRTKGGVLDMYYIPDIAGLARG
jgi:hypothetical protein